METIEMDWMELWDEVCVLVGPTKAKPLDVIGKRRMAVGAIEWAVAVKHSSQQIEAMLNSDWKIL